MHITSAARAQPVQTELTRSRAQQKRYPTAAAASVPRATAGAAFVAAAPAEAPDGPGAGASVAVATPTKDDATTAAVAAAARILSLRVAAISIASYESTGDAGNGELTRKLARAWGCLIWDEKKSERCRVYIAAIGEAFRLFLRCMCALFRQGRVALE